MAGLQPAYRYDYAPAHVRPHKQTSPRPALTVVRGKATQNLSNADTRFVTLAKIAGIVILALALFGFVRIGLISATVTTSLSTERIENANDQLRNSSSDLEVKQSSLVNPSGIKMKALAIGMAAPEETLTIDLEPDVVKTKDGKLSLSESLAALSSQR